MLVVPDRFELTTPSLSEMCSKPTELWHYIGRPGKNRTFIPRLSAEGPGPLDDGTVIFQMVHRSNHLFHHLVILKAYMVQTPYIHGI